jgi:hypothetical protein
MKELWKEWSEDVRGQKKYKKKIPSRSTTGVTRRSTSREHTGHEKGRERFTLSTLGT